MKFMIPVRPRTDHLRIHTATGVIAAIQLALVDLAKVNKQVCFDAARLLRQRPQGAAAETWERPSPPLASLDSSLADGTE